MKSAIYSGSIFHSRKEPFNHEFKYSLNMAYINLKEINNLLPNSFFWGFNKKALISFNRSDYLDRPEKNLIDAVKNLVFERIGKKIKGPIYLLAHLRTLGHCFNPVSFYYCFDKSEKKIDAIIAEVTNTPWKERYSYVIDCENSEKNNLFKNIQKKELHVSPFFGMNHQYHFSISKPGNLISIKIDNFKKGVKVHEASLSLNKDLPKGHVLQNQDLVLKKPSTGISPKLKKNIVGKKLKNNVSKNNLLKISDLE